MPHDDLASDIRTLTALAEELTALLAKPIEAPDIVIGKLREYTELAERVQVGLERTTPK